MNLARKILSASKPSGITHLKLIKEEAPAVIVPRNWARPIRDYLSDAWPHTNLHPKVREYRSRNWYNAIKALHKFALARAIGIQHYEPALYGLVIPRIGPALDLGLLSTKLITNNGVAFMVDAWQNLVEPEIMKFHGIGTGAVAEAQADSALGTELTTQYNPDNTRATGSLTEGASANIFRTVGTNSVDAAVAITEHGLLSQAATGGGTLWDRSVFAAINLANGDSLQTTHDTTLTAGG